MWAVVRIKIISSLHCYARNAELLRFLKEQHEYSQPTISATAGFILCIAFLIITPGFIGQEVISHIGSLLIVLFLIDGPACFLSSIDYCDFVYSQILSLDCNS